MRKIKERIKENPELYKLYGLYRDRYKLTHKYKFIDRKKNSDNLCIILAGYKQFLWSVTMDRIRNCIPDDYDVCIVSSGIYSQELEKIANNNAWSYMSIERNNVSLAQNVAINEFKTAKNIIKIDEDIFVTKNMFENLEETYNSVQDYDIGIVSPILNINGFGHLEILKKYELVDYYTDRFEKPIYAADPNRMLESDPHVAEFFWGKGSKMESIDSIAKGFQNNDIKYKVCPIKLSIGCIYFKRTFWHKMGMFKVYRKGSGMGNDEFQINAYCMTESKPVIISERAVAGHLSFGSQNTEMKKYFLDNIEEFELK